MVKNEQIRENSYKTRQRELVLDYLKNEDRCIAADEIIKALNLSKATVYRCLDLFVKDGQALKFTGEFGERSVYRYNENHQSHFHLKCTDCGETFCADCAFLNDIEKHFMSHHGFGLNKSQTVFYGTCLSCRKAKGQADFSR